MTCTLQQIVFMTLPFNLRCDIFARPCGVQPTFTELSEIVRYRQHQFLELQCLNSPRFYVNDIIHVLD
jgi:hypothetical protein